MKLKGIYRTVLILLALVITVGADQATKSMMRAHIHPYDRYFFFKGHVTLLNVQNTGAFLSLGDKLPNPYHFILLTLLPVVALLGGLLYIILKNNFTLTALLGIVFVIGGGMGNLYDRIVYGSVTDFVHIQYGRFQTGVFNLADIFIMVGVGLLLLDAVLKSSRSRRKPVSEAV